MGGGRQTPSRWSQSSGCLAQLGLLYETADHHVGLKKWTAGEGWSDQPDDRIGFARGCACQSFHDGDPYAIALSLNAHRRHLKPEQYHAHIEASRARIKAALERDGGKSDRALAAELGVSDKTIAKMRKSTAEGSAVGKRIGKDGKARKKPAKAPKKPALPPADEVERDRAECIALYKKAEAAEHELAQHLEKVAANKAATTTPEPVPAEITTTEPPEVTPARVNASDPALEEFDRHILRLIQQTKAGAKPQRFLKTAVPTRDLYALAVLLTELVALKKLTAAAIGESRLIPAGNGVGPEQSADQMKAKHAALDEQPASETAR